MALRGFHENLMAGLDGAGETDPVDFGRFDDCVADDGTFADDEIEHTVGKARARDNVRDGPAAARGQLRGLEHDGVPERQRGRDLPSRNGNGEVPRRDNPDDTERLARHFHTDAGADRGHQLTAGTEHFTPEEFEDVTGAGDFTDAFLERLSFFAREEASQFLASLENLAANSVECVGTRLDARLRPARESGTRCLDGVLGLLFVRARVLADTFRQIRGVDVRGVAVALDPFTTDELIVCSHSSRVYPCTDTIARLTRVTQLPVSL